MEKTTTNKKGFKPIDNAIQRAWKALFLNRNSDGGWGRLGGDKSDLWNTSFILDCLVKAREEGSIKKENIEEGIKGFVDTFVTRWQDVNVEIEKESIEKKIERFEEYISSLTLQIH